MVKATNIYVILERTRVLGVARMLSAVKRVANFARQKKLKKYTIQRAKIPPRARDAEKGRSPRWEALAERKNSKLIESVSIMRFTRKISVRCLIFVDGKKTHRSQRGHRGKKIIRKNFRYAVQKKRNDTCKEERKESLYEIQASNRTDSKWRGD